jgi:hypothetical protein
MENKDLQIRDSGLWPVVPFGAHHLEHLVYFSAALYLLQLSAFFRQLLLPMQTCACKKLNERKGAQFNLLVPEKEEDPEQPPQERGKDHVALYLYKHVNNYFCTYEYLHVYI